MDKWMLELVSPVEVDRIVKELREVAKSSFLAPERGTLRDPELCIVCLVNAFV
jgi:hypothetical protein